ncbi:MAG: hypothetical protein AAF329_08340, partial [Cyanobacteria bacterium P01_A01_bin.17]
LVICYLQLESPLHQSPITNHQSPITNHQSPITNHQSLLTTHHSLLTTHPPPSYNGVKPMPSLFYLAFGEGQFSTTASGVFSGLAVFVVCCIVFVVLAYRNYPVDQD